MNLTSEIKYYNNIMCTETEVKYIRKVVTAGSFSSLSIHFTKYNVLSAYNHIHDVHPINN